MARLQTSLPFADFKVPADAIRSLYQAIVSLLQGKANNTASGTLTAGTTTTVLEPLVTVQSHITLTPLSAASATALASAYVSSRVQGTSFTITHGVAVGTETFTYAIH